MTINTSELGFFCFFFKGRWSLYFARSGINILYSVDNFTLGSMDVTILENQEYFSLSVIMRHMHLEVIRTLLFRVQHPQQAIIVVWYCCCFLYKGFKPPVGCLHISNNSLKIKHSPQCTYHFKALKIVKMFNRC